jgi:hypothetical protein
MLMYDVEHNNLPTYVYNAFLEYRNLVVDVRLRHRQDYRFPQYVSQRFIKSTVLSSIKQWDTLPTEFKMRFSRNSVKYNTRVFLNGPKNRLVSPKLDLPRSNEINFNKTF